MGEKLKHILTLNAILLLCNSFSIPKLLYILRASPVSFLPSLTPIYDETLKSIVSSEANIHFVDDDPAWSQATLLIRVGGLGIRCAVKLASSAFLASTATSSGLVQHICQFTTNAIRWCPSSHNGLRVMTLLPLVHRRASRRPGMHIKHKCCGFPPGECPWWYGSSSAFACFR